jgi:hypothetical protein
MNYPVASFIEGSPAGNPAAGAVAGEGNQTGAGGMGGMGGGADPAGPRAGIPVTSTPGQFSRPVYVRDVATVTDAYWERRSGYHYLKHDKGTEGEIAAAIEVSVIQTPGASSAEVVPAVMKVARQLEAENPGIRFEVAYDNAHFVNVLFTNIWEELLTAILLTGIAVLLFLGEWRGTLIAMITLPTSLAMAVLLMMPFGMTFNRLGDRHPRGGTSFAVREIPERRDHRRHLRGPAGRRRVDHHDGSGAASAAIFRWHHPADVPGTGVAVYLRASVLDGRLVHTDGAPLREAAPARRRPGGGSAALAVEPALHPARSRPAVA